MLPSLPRAQLFEFNDAPWAPTALKSHIIESLSRTLAWGRVLEGLVPAFTTFLDATGSTEVVDVCAGAGGPAAILADELRKGGRAPPRFVLTDLLPHPEAWEALQRERPDCIDFVRAPVDATRLSPDLGPGQPRMIINALHHFPPDLACAVLAGAAQGASGLFIAEGLVRNPARATAMAFAGLPALYLNPLLSGRDGLKKALLTWPAPVALAASVWDAAVSSLRIYSADELRALTLPWGRTWQWETGEFSYLPWGKGMYFWGVPAPGGVSARTP